MREQSTRITIFGHFSGVNFGNDSTLRALLYQVHHRLRGAASVTCICTDPLATESLYRIPAISMNGICIRGRWFRGNRVGRALWKLVCGFPLEIYRWYETFKALSGMDVFIVAGTGLLTDAYGLRNWGPYTLFKWTVIAHLRGCKILFISVGAGPILTHAGRWLVRACLSFATFRSYRDIATKELLDTLGVKSNGDSIYPDLAFSLPKTLTRSKQPIVCSRPVVGLGVMLYSGRLSLETDCKLIQDQYLETLAEFARWLIHHNYDIRLLVGDVCDIPVIHRFVTRLKDRSVAAEAPRLIYEPAWSVDSLILQLNLSDVVVATRFHNIVLALLLNKPVISISCHQKCTSLMREMGLSSYCQDITLLRYETLVHQFEDLQANVERLRTIIKRRTLECRTAADEQYNIIFGDILQSGRRLEKARAAGR